MSLMQFIHDANTVGVIGKLDEGRDEEHAAAWRKPRAGFEACLRAFLEALANYAEGHERRFLEPLGIDADVGGPWRAIAQTVLEILDGDTGRFDPEILDACLRELGMRAGFMGVDLW